jgi:DNA-binding protein WhiA
MPARPCCQLSELLGIFFSTRGRLIRSGTGQAAYFSLLRNNTARKVVRLGRTLGQIEAKYHAVRSAKRMSFFIELPLPPNVVMPFTQPAARALPDRPCDRKAMLRGFFLGCGSVNAPSARYHLEFVAPTFGWATALVYLMHESQIRSGMTERAGQQVVYVKEGDAIVRCMSTMGASRAVMEFENVRVVREVSGHVNRRLNFETANIDKTIGSALKQVAAIEKLDRERVLDKLSPALQEMARWRKTNPELNLNELANRMNLSKSAINHRLRRLVEISDTVADPETAELAGSARPG